MSLFKGMVDLDDEMNDSHADFSVIKKKGKKKPLLVSSES